MVSSQPEAWDQEAEVVSPGCKSRHLQPSKLGHATCPSLALLHVVVSLYHTYRQTGYLPRTVRSGVSCSVDANIYTTDKGFTILVGFGQVTGQLSRRTARQNAKR